MRLVYILLLGLLVGLYLVIRGWVDHRKEKILDTEIVREGEEHLGRWAGKWNKGMILFRLRRDNTFMAQYVEAGRNDTLYKQGQYDIIGGNNTAYYPRLVALDEKKDTLVNCFIAYVTPYDTKVEKVDRLVLSPQSIYDTVSFTFYRIKP